MLFEIDGDVHSVDYNAKKLEKVCLVVGALDFKIPKTKEEEDALWAGRKNVGAAVSKIDKKLTRIYLADDIAVPIKNVPPMLREINRLSEKYKLPIPIVTYGHIGDGNLHTGIAIDVNDDEQWELAEKVAADIYKSAFELEGSATGEHGVGFTKSEWMKKEHESSFDIMVAIKKALDQNNIMNPGKMGL